MSAEDLMPEANEELTPREQELLQTYGSAEPDPEFASSLGRRLGEELVPIPEVEPIDRANRAVALVLAAVAAGLLLMAGGVGAGVWYLMSRSQGDNIAEVETNVPQDSTPAQDQADATSANEPGETTQIADVDPVGEPAAQTPLDAARAPANRPGTPVAEGLTGRPRTDEPPKHETTGGPAAEAPAKAGTLRYGWQTGKAYAYNFSIESKIGDEQHLSSGRVAYEAVEPASANRAAAEVEHATGTGFVVTAEGHLVTCAHVVRGATQVEVNFGDMKYQAEVLGLDKRNDLALLKIDAPGLAVLPLGDSAAVELAQDVRVVGYPLTDVLGSSIKVTTGTVAGFIDQEGDRLFQVDAPINAGNSGGPVVNQRGHVVGVASAKLSGEEISNVGFAVPVAEVCELLRRHQIAYREGRGGDELAGPDLARQVTPAVGLIEVTIGSGGVGLERQIQLNYSATMTTKDPPSARANPRDPFGGPFGPGMRFGPRGFRGNAPKTERGKLLVDVIGETSDSEFDLNLPYLFGPVALLAIDPLGEEGETSWYRQRTISLIRTREEEHDNSPFGPRLHRPPFFPDPFAPREEPRKKVVGVTSAFERYDYELGDVSTDTITVKKKYNLKTLEADADPKITMTGSGEIVFDRAEGVPKSSTFSGVFEVASGNVALKIPVTLTYSATDPNPPAPQPAAVAAQPATPPKPVDRTLRPDKIDGVLRRLRSDDQNDVQQVLAELRFATPGERQQELALAIEPHLKHKDWVIRQSAAQALAIWAVPANTTVLIAALQDGDFTVRREAMKTLGKFPSHEAAEAIVSAYAKSAHEAKSALIAIGPVAEEAVLTLLHDSHWVYRGDACEILGKIGSAKSLDALRDAQKETNGLVKNRAKDAVAAIEGRNGASPSPEAAPASELDKKYRGPGALTATDRSVTSDTELFVGQILLVLDSRQWYPADILELLDDGRVKIHFRGWGSSWDKVVERTALQLAPDELTQPARPAEPEVTISPQSNRSATNTTPANTPPANALGADRTAEETLRAFLLALLLVDRESAKPLIAADTDSDSLWTATPPSEPAIAMLTSRVDGLELQVLKVGDIIELPGGKKVTLTERHINDERVNLTFPGNTVPFILVKTADGWRVDVRTVVAARRAAQQARAKQP